MQNGLLIGLGAGVASALLYASAWTGTAIGLFVLFFLSPMPIAIASLGWGWAAGGIASAAAFIIVTLAGGPRTGFVYLFTLAAPAVVFSYLALLTRAVPSADGQEPHVEWYPIGRIVMWASLWAGLIASAALLNLGTDASAIRAAVLDLLDKTVLRDSIGPAGAALTTDEKSSIAAVVAIFLPWMMATTWFAVAMLNLWLAARVTHRSGRLTRPWPPLQAITMPPAMPLAFGAAAIGTLMPDMPGLISSGFASALVFAFMLVGLGILHRMTLGNAMRPFLLGLVYAGLIFLPPLLNLLVALVGLAEPYLRGRLPPPQAPPAPQT